jgi:hypothetical protein
MNVKPTMNKKSHLGDLVKDRERKQQAIMELRMDLNEIEYQVVQELISKDMTMYFKVDWTKLKRDS